MKNVSLLFLLLVLFSSLRSLAQDGPNESNSATSSVTSRAVQQLSDMSVNLFTGEPQIGFPLYSYKDDNGLSVDVAVSYHAGGIKLGEGAEPCGLGWILNAGGVITRTVRGRPDDIPGGYIVTPPLPDTFFSSAYNYYRDISDAQQDVFHYNFNGHAGDFLIGKNNQIITIPTSNGLKISFTLDSSVTHVRRINSFTLLAEDGVKYLFDVRETECFRGDWSNGSTFFSSGYENAKYTTAWHLGKMISPFNTDTVSFDYISKTDTSSEALPHSIIVNNRTKHIDREARPAIIKYVEAKKLALITLPDKNTIRFGYDTLLNHSEMVLNQLWIRDTGLLRGYKFEYSTQLEVDSAVSRESGSACWKPVLKKITPHTTKGYLPGFSFHYQTSMPAAGKYSSCDNDTLSNYYDYWGYFNGRYNGKDALGRNKDIPSVAGLYDGANREPQGSSPFNLHFLTTPDGASFYYNWDRNYIRQYITNPQSLVIDAAGPASSSISVSNVYGPKTRFILTLDSSVNRAASMPIDSNSLWICSIVNVNSVVISTDTISLSKLFHYGSQTFEADLPDGNYTFESAQMTGSLNNASFKVNLQWEKTEFTNNNIEAGGLRIFRISYYNSKGEIKVKWYKYLDDNGYSSGFSEGIPKYHYPYGDSLTYISSKEYTNSYNYNGSFIGYKRVEVVKGDNGSNMGKEVYEFTDLKDVRDNIQSKIFPVTPATPITWGLGLTKKVSIYDSSGNKIKVTANAYEITDRQIKNPYFKSFKLSYHPLYTGRDYYPRTGIVLLRSTADTIFFKDNSFGTESKTFYYDTNYQNLVKTSATYDSTRGLRMEERFYYPYNYTTGIMTTMKNNNIIRPVIASETWLIGDSSERIVKGNIMNYLQDLKGRLRLGDIAVLQTSKPVPLSTIKAFNPALLNRNTTYFKVKNTFSKYDTAGKLLEVRENATNRYSAIIRDYSNKRIIAKVADARYDDIAYTSFEAEASGNWIIGSISRIVDTAITGRRSYRLSNGNISKTGLDSTKSYTITYWATGVNTVSASAGAPAQLLDSKGVWDLYEIRVSGVKTITLSGNGLIDELRLFPTYTAMETFCYNPDGTVSNASDKNNRILYYEYDKISRPVVIRDIRRNIIKKYEYDVAFDLGTIDKFPHWSQPLLQCSPFSDTSASLYWHWYDANPASNSFLQYKDSLYERNCSYCTPICPKGREYKFISTNCECQYGTRIYDVLPHQTPDPVTDQYKCYFHLEWSDNSTLYSPDFYYYSLSPCTTTGPTTN